MNVEEAIQSNEAVLLAGLAAQVKLRVQRGADVYDILADEVPTALHADLVEALDRLGVLV